MRTGIDVRRYHKPSVFVELVDTRWDEYNRVAEMNLTGGMIDPHVVVTPTGYPNAVGTLVPGATGVPPAMPPDTPQDGPTDGGRGSEPSPLPPAPVEPLPPPPGVGPTAQLSPTRGPQLDVPPAEASAPNDAGDRPAPANDDVNGPQSEEAEGADKVKLSSFLGIPYRRSAKASDRAGNARQEAAPAEKPARRPTLSRLFSK
jgi:hypothetical protein